MSMIRKRTDEDLVVAPGTAPASVGGFVSGAENSLLEPGTANTSALKVAPTSSAESAVGALRETLGAKALRGVEYMQIPSEEGFDPAAALGDKLGQFSEDELEFLGDSRSSTELAQRLGQVTQTRQNLQDMAANPVAAFAASMLDVDAVIGLGVAGAATRAGRTARLVTGLTANSAVLGLASEGGEVTPLDIVGTTLGVALGAIPTVRRAATVAEDVVEDVPGAARAVPDVEPVQPPDVEPVQPPEVAPQRVPDPDYVQPTPDVTTARPYVEVTRQPGQATIRTSTANLLGATLTLGDDMPEGSRLLGAALFDSMKLDGDVPLVLSRARGRPHVRLEQDGSISTNMRVEGGSEAPDLSARVAGMSAYDKTIVLHEAAHAKTISAIDLFERGALKPGPVLDAVSEIDQLRNVVRGALDSVDRAGISPSDWKNNVLYGLSNTHEFVSQLFNSDSFRQVLHQVKVPGEPRSVWSDLVQRVVTAFTGKGPEDTALTRLVSAFEDVLAQPAIDSQSYIKARAANDVPRVQSAALQGAPDVQSMFRKSGTAMNQAFALFDKIQAIGPRAATLANQLVIDATGNSAQSAAHYARTAHLAANVAAAQVDATIRQALSEQGWTMFSRLRNPSGFRAAQQELSAKVYDQLADNHSRFMEGATINPHPEAAVERIVKSFADSRWAEDQLARIKASGMTGADGIEASPYYIPRRHNANKISDYLRDTPGVTRADIEGMYASQFERMFADRGIRPDTARALGRQMLRNMDERAAGVSGYRQHIAGLTNDDIEFAMRNAGIDEDQINQFLNTVQQAGEQSNTVRNLRSRVDFDMTAEYTTRNGQIIYPQMFVDKDVLGLMEGYSRSMSGRIGLAKAGFPDVRSLASAVDEAAAEGVDPRAARTTLDNTVNQLLGYPTGEDVPDILRSFAVMSGAVQLANSGIYQLADSALLIKEFGITKVMRALGSTQWGRDAMKLAQDPTYGSRLRDVLEARNVLSGRYRTVMTHLDDNTDIGSLGVAHQLVQQFGQATRFANGMEYVRRAQSKLMAGLVGDSMDAAVRGDDAAFETMQRFGMTPELRARAKAAMDADPDMRMWPDSIRLDIETVAHNMADTLVLENRLGELPAWMQFSTLGKFILPYMNFVAGTWNKILRRTYAQDGLTGVAMMFAYQLPLTVLSSTVALAQGNKEITPQSLAVNTLTQVPLMSWMGYAVNMLTQGPTNSIAALGLVDKAYSATASIVRGEPDAEQIIRATPFLGIIPGIRIMAGALGEDE
jgi:hypothetical protein